METMSFVLGASTGVVIAIAIVAVLGFVKAKKTEQKLRYIEESILTIYGVIARNSELDNRRIDQEIDRTNNLVTDVYRTIDSRLDKAMDMVERTYITKKNKLENKINY
jgi:hypothetical protein